jgi:ABC-type polysaccharide/polyol phosphate transport system ATPase subunit
VPEAATAIEVRGLEKSFRIPTHKVDSLKERIVRPFAASDYRELRALDGISFEVGKGEFFGIVGRNGSGKSTLLKLLASIYRPDAGMIRMAGRLAPFIELGVGFNPELTARENVVLNGVMMGLTPQETRQRIDAVMDFAELQEFADLKLKNYSSGMLVRLAFSLMLEVDADIMLIDEVLAVGDAAFQQKCADAFHVMKAAGKTIVLVTHDMETVEDFCARAMLIDGGRIGHIGDPAEVGRHYLRLNFEGESDGAASTEESEEVRMLDVWLEDEAGERLANLEQGEPIRLRLSLEARRDTAGVGLGVLLANAEGVSVSNFGLPVGPEDSLEMAAGDRADVRIDLENLLTPGRYQVHVSVSRAADRGVALYIGNAVEFVVYGNAAQSRGVVSLPREVSSTIERRAPR